VREPHDTIAAPLQLFFIRHGETEWSLSGQHTGRTDIALTTDGERDARKLAPYLRRFEFTHVLTSPMLRARQTCDLAGLGGVAEIEPDLSEWDYGEYEGRLTSDIQKAFPSWNVFRDGCPQGESPAQVSRRANRLMERLKGFKGNVALFSHGQFGASFGARWIGLPVLEGQHFLLSAPSLSILTCNPMHPERQVIRLWNATVEILPDKWVTPA
jgi:broad specificity phosphatase PhoE